MGEMLKVGMADLKVCKAPDNITTIGLGSCIGIAMYDPSTKITGLVHIMLPDSKVFKGNIIEAKFADTGIPALLQKMLDMGANKNKIVAKIAGGAKMFSVTNNTTINVGERNAEASVLALRKLGIPLLGQDTGLNYGRTVEIYSEDGHFLVKSVGKPPKTL